MGNGVLHIQRNQIPEGGEHTEEGVQHTEEGGGELHTEEEDDNLFII